MTSLGKQTNPFLGQKNATFSVSKCSIDEWIGAGIGTSKQKEEFPDAVIDLLPSIGISPKPRENCSVEMCVRRECPTMYHDLNNK